MHMNFSEDAQHNYFFSQPHQPFFMFAFINAIVIMFLFILSFSGVAFLALDIHTLVLGFVFTVLIGFGTRVTLGHSANSMEADKWTTYLFYWTQVVVVTRLFTSLVTAFGWNFMLWFDISAVVWILMFLAWSVRFFAVLIQGKKLS